MAKTVGVVMTEKVVAGLIEDHKVVGELRHFPEHSGAVHDPDENGGLIELPADAVAELLCEQIAALAPAGSGVEAAGIALHDTPQRDARRLNSAARWSQRGDLLAEQLRHRVGRQLDQAAVLVRVVYRTGMLRKMPQFTDYLMVFDQARNHFFRHDYADGLCHFSTSVSAPDSVLKPGQAIHAVKRGCLVALGQSGIVEHGIDEIVYGALQHHHRLSDVHQLRRALADNVHAQDLPRLAVKNQLQPPRRVAAYLSARNLPVVRYAHFVRYVFLGKLLFRLADEGDLRNGIDPVGIEAGI